MARVLVVDDSKIMRKKVGAMLTAIGHEMAAEAGDGAEAYEKYKAVLPDVVTMDITMEGVDGVSSLRSIIADFPDAKVIMVTALGQKDMVIKAVSSGAAYYLVKPIKQEKLAEAIQKVLA